MNRQLPVAQFGYGLTWSGIQDYVESGNIANYLPSKAVKQLIDFGAEAEEETCLIKKFKQEQVISVSNIAPVKDIHGRAGTWNHTILVRVEDYIQFTEPETLFRAHFVRDSKDGERIRRQFLEMDAAL